MEHFKCHNRIGGRILLVCAIELMFLVSVPVRAQVVGATLSGTITDQSGAVVPGAELSIKNSETGITRKVTSDKAGFYSSPNLLPGRYAIDVTAAGFATLSESGVSLAVGDQRALNLVLRVGQSSQTVQVTSVAPTIQLNSSTISGEVDSQTVRELPLNGRDWTQLATLQVGVVSVRTQASTSSGGSTRSIRGYGNQLAAGGHRPYENSFRVNGISVVDYANGSPGSVTGGALGVDGIEQFAVLTSNYTAEYGRTSGAVITAITKSGTNQLHGDVYWFLRDKKLDAKNYFDKVIPPFHRNQFGASLGGPLRKNKTFIFADYEGIRQDKGLSFQDTVLSPAARAGTLCSIPNATCSTTNIKIDPLVAPFLGFYPLPNGAITGNGDTGLFSASGLQVLSENYIVVRGDHKFSDADNIAASWSYDKAPFSQPDPLLVVNNALETDRQNATLEETHIFSAALLNNVRIGYSRSVGLGNEPINAVNPLASDLSLGAIPGRAAPILVIPGLTQMPGGLGGASFNSNTWNSFQAYDDAFLTRGNHSIKFGFAWERMQLNLLSKPRQNGTFTFPSLSGFLENQPTNVQLLDPNVSQEIGTRQSIFAGYVQDDWHLRPNLTVNYGIRYEPVTLPTEAHNQFLVVESLFGGGVVPVHTLWASNQSLRNFDPRIGLSWDPFRTGKTAVRAGFGVYDVLPINWEYTTGTASSLPFSLNVTVGNLPAGSFPTGALALVGFNPKKALVRYVQPNPPRNYAMNWNLNIQQEITPSLTMMIGYVGSHTIHQAFTPNEADIVLPTLTAAGYLWPFPVGSGTISNPDVGNIRATQWDGTASYDSLQAQVTQKLSHGMQAQASYTWGKCLDDASNAQTGDPFLNSVGTLPYYDSHLRRGLCDYNVAHNFVANFIWNIPTPKLKPVKNLFLGGWQAGGIFSASTGTPFTLLTAGDPLGIMGSDPNSYPSRILTGGCSGNPVNPRNVGNFVKINCFTPPTAPVAFAKVCQSAAAAVAALIPNTCMNLLGNAGRNSLVGPGFSEFDFSLFKNIPIKEGLHAQFRAEFFNLPNRANFQSPLDHLTVIAQNGTPVSNAGAIDGTSGDPRQIQFGLKVIW
jgi:Carboxypeptidase regulatory-like domain/TonB dependent receptor-like, beta-barrel